MREVASKAATGESTAGLLKIMDQIAGLSAPRSLPPIAAGGYRVLEVRRDRPRPSRAAALAPLTGKPMRMRGFLTALFAGGLGLAVLAGPATCPTCDPAHADGQLDAKRILSRLTTRPATPSSSPRARRRRSRGPTCLRSPNAERPQRFPSLRWSSHRTPRHRTHRSRPPLSTRHPSVSSTPRPRRPMRPLLQRRMGRVRDSHRAGTASREAAGKDRGAFRPGPAANPDRRSDRRERARSRRFRPWARRQFRSRTLPSIRRSRRRACRRRASTFRSRRATPSPARRDRATPPHRHPGSTRRTSTRKFPAGPRRCSRRPGRPRRSRSSRAAPERSLAQRAAPSA